MYLVLLLSLELLNILLFCFTSSYKSYTIFALLPATEVAVFGYSVTEPRETPAVESLPAPTLHLCCGLPCTAKDPKGWVSRNGQ